jgi:hypothetical protein
MGSIALLRGFYPHGAALRRSKVAPARKRKSLVRRIFAAIERSHQRYIDREIARFMAGRGDRLTDDVERQLNERFSYGTCPPYAAPRPRRPFGDE